MSCARGCCGTPAEHYRSVNFGPVTVPEGTAIERTWERDIPAYKAMRKQGLRPPTVKGAGDLAARAESVVEVEKGRIINDPRMRRKMDAIHKEVSV